MVPETLLNFRNSWITSSWSWRERKKSLKSRL